MQHDSARALRSLLGGGGAISTDLSGQQAFKGSAAPVQDARAPEQLKAFDYQTLGDFIQKGMQTFQQGAAAYDQGQERLTKNDTITYKAREPLLNEQLKEAANSIPLENRDDPEAWKTAFKQRFDNVFHEDDFHASGFRENRLSENSSMALAAQQKDNFDRNVNKELNDRSSIIINNSASKEEVDKGVSAWKNDKDSLTTPEQKDAVMLEAAQREPWKKALFEHILDSNTVDPRAKLQLIQRHEATMSAEQFKQQVKYETEGNVAALMELNADAVAKGRMTNEAAMASNQRAAVAYQHNENLAHATQVFKDTGSIGLAKLSVPSKSTGGIAGEGAISNAEFDAMTAEAFSEKWSAYNKDKNNPEAKAAMANFLNKGNFPSQLQKVGEDFLKRPLNDKGELQEGVEDQLNFMVDIADLLGGVGYLNTSGIIKDKQVYNDIKMTYALRHRGIKQAYMDIKSGEAATTGYTVSSEDIQKQLDDTGKMSAYLPQVSFNKADSDLLKNPDVRNYVADTIRVDAARGVPYDEIIKNLDDELSTVESIGEINNEKIFLFGGHAIEDATRQLTSGTKGEFIDYVHSHLEQNNVLNELKDRNVELSDVSIRVSPTDPLGLEFFTPGGHKLGDTVNVEELVNQGRERNPDLGEPIGTGNIFSYLYQLSDKHHMNLGADIMRGLGAVMATTKTGFINFKSDTEGFLHDKYGNRQIFKGLLKLIPRPPSVDTNELLKRMSRKQEDPSNDD